MKIELIKNKIQSGILELWQDKFAQTLFFIFSLVFGLIKSLAEFVFIKDKVGVDVLQSGIYAVICYALLNFTYWVITRDYKVKPVEIKSPRRLWWTFFGILLCTYILCWMTYGTALISQDNMLIYYWGIKLSCQHPIFYMAFVLLSKNIGLMLGSMLYGVWFYTIIQMLIIAVILATVLMWVFTLQISKIIKYLIAVYYILVPIFPIFALNMEKDPLFSIAMLTMTLSMYNIIKHNTKRDWIIFFISIFFVEILRNNGLYITLGTLIVLLFNFKSLYKNIFIAFCIIIVTFLISSFAMSSVGAKQLFQEKVGVPIQQIAAVVKEDGTLTDEQKEFINQIMPLENIKKAYNPYASDAIKWAGVKHGFNSDFLETHQKEFMECWFAILLDNFDIYTKAYLKVSIGWWAPYYFKNIDYKSFWSPGISELRNFAEKNNLMINTIIKGNAKEYLEKYYDLSKYFPREGMLLWLLCLCAFMYYLKQRTLKDLIIYLPSFILWLTIMIAAPKARGFRYVLSFAYLLPFYIALLLENRENILKLENSEACRKYIIMVLKTLLGLGILFYAIWYFTIGQPVKARADISTSNHENPTFLVIQDNEQVSEANWMQNFGRRGIVIQQIGNKVSFMIVAFKNEDINIILRGPDERDSEGKLLEKWVKYTDFRINGRKILSEPINVWHSKPFTYVLKSEKNHLYKIELSWRKK